ncbi:hypothetical protein H7J86_26355 [Mycobacterium hackensackense]|uniref:hypothetical protein n=1 Tax=Mycobacterium hackensackense TaxID=228909 RepID=UPI002265F6D3|nr:hypothetical protein [Mycobacterium hackensackense]MCV7255692.1 hypothetical protein [Mycobacterium hackensackense]
MTATDERTTDAEDTAAEDTKPKDAEQSEEDDAAAEFAALDKFIKRTTTKNTIDFRGRKFSFPRARAKWPTRAMQIFQRGVMERYPDAVELMLGAEQWDEFLDVAPLIEDFWEFFTIFARAAGFERAPGAAEKK